MQRIVGIDAPIPDGTRSFARPEHPARHRLTAHPKHRIDSIRGIPRIARLHRVTESVRGLPQRLRLHGFRGRRSQGLPHRTHGLRSVRFTAQPSQQLPLVGQSRVGDVAHAEDVVVSAGQQDAQTLQIEVFLFPVRPGRRHGRTTGRFDVQNRIVAKPGEFVACPSPLQLYFGATDLWQVMLQHCKQS